MAWDLKSIESALMDANRSQAQEYFAGLVWKKLQAEMCDIMADECIPTAWESVRNLPGVALYAPPLAARIATLAQASAHVLYSMGDTLAQCVNVVCDLQIDEQDVSFAKVRGMLRSKDDLSRISTAMADLEHAEWFLYYGAFANITKHRTIIASSRGMSPDHTEMVVRFHGFTYTSKRDKVTREYEPRLARDLLKCGRDEVVGLVGLAWDALERHLEAHVPQEAPCGVHCGLGCPAKRQPAMCSVSAK